MRFNLVCLMVAAAVVAVFMPVMFVFRRGQGLTAMFVLEELVRLAGGLAAKVFNHEGDVFGEEVAAAEFGAGGIGFWVEAGDGGGEVDLAVPFDGEAFVGKADGGKLGFFVAVHQAQGLAAEYVVEPGVALIGVEQEVGAGGGGFKAGGGYVVLAGTGVLDYGVAFFGERGAAEAFAGLVADFGVTPALVFGFLGGAVEQLGDFAALFVLAFFSLLAEVFEGVGGGVDVFHAGSL